MSIEVMTCVWKHAPVQSDELLILLALADFADDDGGCWPAVETLADRARMTPRNVQRCLRGLAERGLISILEKAGPKGVNRYVVRPDEIRAQSKARIDGESAGGDNLSGVTPASDGVPPASQGGDAGVTQTVTEPPLEPSQEREARARDQSPEGDNPDTAAQTETVRGSGKAAFKAAHAAWPTYTTDSSPEAERAWHALEPACRVLAAEEAGRYVEASRATGRTKVCSFGVYLRERRWEKLAPREAEAPAVLEAKPFGPVWQAARLRDLLAGPQVERFRLTAFEEGMIADGRLDRDELLRDRRVKAGWPSVNRMHDLAEQRRSLAVEPSPEIERLAKTMVACPAGGDAMAAWRALHDERGWPWLPDTGAQPVVFWPSPALDPEAALAAFEAQLEAHVEPAGRSASPPATGKTGNEAAE